jgi:hypothetical protein
MHYKRSGHRDHKASCCGAPPKRKRYGRLLIRVGRGRGHRFLMGRGLLPRRFVEEIAHSPRNRSRRVAT